LRVSTSRWAAKFNSDYTFGICVEVKQETGFQSVETRLLDLNSFASVSAFADEIEKDDVRVDVLIANAAMQSLRYGQATDGWEST
jgi:NAD(P)-dependent dehydrogenase (short-subunit alcohol dehydrogenase family)